MKWSEFRKPARCPHARIRGIYGDEIIYTPRWRRLQCLDCGRLLNGPVSLATHISINGGIFPVEGYGPSSPDSGSTEEKNDD